jgi:pyridoxamine 5'-phosphate oxidase
MASLLIPTPEDPVRTASQWLGEAEALGRRNANAMALASVDASGQPSARMVLLKELAPLGYAVFYTNYGSRKGAELLSTRRAAAVLYWHELGRQVRLEGPVVRSPEAESDAYFANARARQSDQRVEQRAEPPATGARRARGTRRADRGHQGSFRSAASA